MSYNGSGVYTLPGAQLVNGEIVSASENNTLRNDMATAFNTAWTRDGQSPATGNIPMGSHKFTGLAAGSENGDSVRYEQATSAVAITGGTINGVTIGGTTPPDATFNDIEIDGQVNGVVEFVDEPTFDSGITTLGAITFGDGSVQSTAADTKQFYPYTSTTSYTVPDGVTTIRAYAFGAGANGTTTNGGGGGGCAFGDFDVVPSETLTITISAGVATVSFDGVTLLTANAASGTTGGTASKDVSVTNGGAYSGGAGGSGANSGGGSSGSPLGNGYAGGSGYGNGGGGGAGGEGGTGGGGAGGSGASVVSKTAGGGGAGGPQLSNGGPGKSRGINNLFTDPLMAHCTSPGGAGSGAYAYGASAGAGGGGGSCSSTSDVVVGGAGGDFGGGGFGGSTAAYATGGQGGFGGGGGGASGVSGSSVGGAGGYGGGGGSGSQVGGAGGAAIVLLYL